MIRLAKAQCAREEIAHGAGPRVPGAPGTGSNPTVARNLGRSKPRQTTSTTQAGRHYRSKPIRYQGSGSRRQICLVLRVELGEVDVQALLVGLRRQVDLVGGVLTEPA